MTSPEEVAGAVSQENLPAFGERVAGADYIVRPSAYALVLDARGRLAIAETPEGLFLPGGGIERGETEREAVVREALEECGLPIRTGDLIGRAVQLARAQSLEAYYEKRCSFIAGEIEGPPSAPTEVDHKLRWLEPGEGARLLTHGSHRWAVLRWRPR